MPEIVEAHRITGDDCFIVRIVVEEMPQLETAIDALAKFGPVTTSIVLASYPPKAVVGPGSFVTWLRIRLSQAKAHSRRPTNNRGILRPKAVLRYDKRLRYRPGAPHGSQGRIKGAQTIYY